VNALKQASQPLEPKTKPLSSPSLPKDLKKGHLNSIRDSMFIVKGVFEQRLPLNLKVLLNTRANCLYVS
jgi:hypothetical protein